MRCLAFLVVLFATPAFAQSSFCNSRQAFLDHLSENYAEGPVAMGVTASGNVLEVLTSETGSWTIIVTNPKGMACGFAAGENWEDIKPQPKGPQT